MPECKFARLNKVVPLYFVQLLLFYFVSCQFIIRLLAGQFIRCIPYLFGYKTGVSPLQNDYK